MFFVTDRRRLRQMIRLVRDDRHRAQRGVNSPFLRIAAQGGELTLSGRQMEATFPATVYEPGVIFIRTTLFRRLLETFTEADFLALQVDRRGLHLGNVFVSFDRADMVLFPIGAQAPPRWPAPLPAGERPEEVKAIEERGAQGELFGEPE